MKTEEDSYKIWTSGMFTVEAIIDPLLWDKRIINDFEKNFSSISNQIFKKSNLVNPSKLNFISASFAGEKKLLNSIIDIEKLIYLQTYYHSLFLKKRMVKFFWVI